MANLIIGISLFAANLLLAILSGYPISWFFVGFMGMAICLAAASYIRERREIRLSEDGKTV